ncbi:MAG: DotA/TraY family protein [Acidiferrobacter sp.]
MLTNTTLPSLAQSQALLTPSKTDQSVSILNNLFGVPGGNWHSLYYQAIGGVGQGSLFFHLLQDFDLVVLAFVTVMVFITMGIGATSTAHEGKAFGNRYHALWTPLRSAFAMVLLAPIPGVGLSLIQGALLLMVWFSIGGANYLATQATQFMVKQGGTISGMTPTGGTRLAREILQSEIAAQYIVNYESQSPPKMNLDSVAWVPPSTGANGFYGTWEFTFNIPSGAKGGWFTSGLAPGSLGVISIPCYSKGGPMCTARKDAVSQMISAEYKYAEKLVNSSQAAPGSSSISSTNKPATAAPSVTDPVVTKAAAIYDAAEAAAVPKEIAASNPALQKELTTLNQNVTNLGWMSLGTFYWDIAGVNEKVQSRIDQTTRWSGYNGIAIAKEIGKPDTKRLTDILEEANADIAATLPTNKKSESLIDEVFGSAGSWFAAGPADLLLKGNPIANLQSAGDGIINIEIPAAVGTYMSLRAATSGANAESKGAPVIGELTSWATGAASAAVKAGGPYVYALLAGLFAIGVTWAYYLPSVPFILWTMGLIGWLIFIIEALVGAVIWAAGIALPEGEGIFGPRGDQGVMLFINVMFRPALMVVGFFASFLLMGVVGNWVGASVSIFMGSMNGAMEWNPITWVATAVIIAVIAVTVTHKIFGLITWIPENVLRWVGGQGVQLGETHDEQKARGHVDAIGAFVNKGAGQQKAKGAGARGGVRKGMGAAGAGADAVEGEGEETVGSEGGGGNDVAGGGEISDMAPPSKLE